jgi:hypothetical protein
MMEETSSKLTPPERGRLMSLIRDYADIFATPGGPLGWTNLIQHTIDTGSARPVRLPPRRMAPTQREVANTEIDKMLKEGVIVESNSPWAAPIVLVKKKDGSTRFCVDYRRLNAITTKDAYLLPRIDETIDTLSGSRWFCTMDLASGYWQLGMDPRDRCKTAFATHRGLYEFKVMAFGFVMFQRPSLG